MGCCCYCYQDAFGEPHCEPGHAYGGDPLPSYTDPYDCVFLGTQAAANHARAEAAFWLEGKDCLPGQGNPCPPTGDVYRGRLGMFARRQCCCPTACCNCWAGTAGPFPVPPIRITLNAYPEFPNTSFMSFLCEDDVNNYLNGVPICLSVLNGAWPLFEPGNPIGPVETCFPQYDETGPSTGIYRRGAFQAWAAISQLIDLGGGDIDRDEANLMCARTDLFGVPSTYYKLLVRCATRGYANGYEFELVYYDEQLGNIIETYQLTEFVPIPGELGDRNFDCSSQNHWIQNGLASATVQWPLTGGTVDVTIEELPVGSTCGVPGP